MSLVFSQIYVTMIAAMGALNGYFYVFRKIKSFIVTICTMFLFRGFIKYLTTNAPVAGSAKLINYDSTELKIACTVVILLIGFAAFINVIKLYVIGECSCQEHFSGSII